MDGDGDVDLAMTSGSLRVYWNSGAGVFPSSSAIGVGASPNKISSADLDGDFAPELAVACANDESVYVVRRTAGTSLAVTAIVDVGVTPRDCAFADVDGDGLVDLVAACQSAGALCWSRGRGNGTFEGSTRLDLNQTAEELIARDYTG